MPFLTHLSRKLLRSPAFTGIALLTVAVGIGANTAIFSVLNGVLLKPLAYADPDRLVAVWHTAPKLGFKDLNASPSTYFTYREENRAFAAVGLYRGDSVSITGVAEPEQVDALFVTHEVLPILGVRPAAGRWFTQKDDSPGSPETVMLLYGYWQRKFGGDSSVIGRRILVDGRAREVIGIMPRTFRFLDSRPSLIAPLQFDRGKIFVGNFSHFGIARLKPGATLAQANADVARMLPMMIDKFPPPPGMSLKNFGDLGIGPNVRPLKNDVIGDIGKVLWVLMATVGIVLLIACANVANLLLVRAEGRQQEFAIRAALGAGWGHIARELLFESVAIGIAGGMLGIGLAHGALRLLVALGPSQLPRLDEISIDGPVLLFTLVISLVSGLLFGLMPVLKHAGPRVAAALRQGGRTLSEGRERHRARNVLVVAQVALALVLLISAGLMIRTIRALKQVQPGFTAPEQILTLRISIPWALVPDERQVLRIDQQILDRIAAIPGVASAALTNSVAMDGYRSSDPAYVEDRVYTDTSVPPMRRYKWVSPGVPRTMGNTIVAGRDFTWTDLHEMRPVVMVSENLAREMWGSPAAALGKRLRENVKGVWREIVGVIGDERDDGADQKAPTFVFWPVLLKDHWGSPISVQRTMAFLVRSPRAGSAGFLDDIRRAVWSVNPNVPIANVRTVAEIQAKSMARTSFTLIMLTIAAGMALLLGVIGIYGVISYSVSQRTREIGIRMALGAEQKAVRQMFVSHGLMLAATGVLFGAAAAVALTRLLSTLLFEVSPLDPLTYFAVSAVLVAAAFLASYVPARKATRIEPVDALRAE